MKLQSVDKSLIQIDVEAENFEDAVRKSMEPLVAQKYVKPSYVEKILSIYRETGPYIVITMHIALPHAD
ncbi:PTS sugar transporter subunit IIA, partial [Enterococcus faecium]|uniref:PTS sugar transporter subunit IIA n=1 Tax=Enterococcus faecium TaxID=1352 RepID=UPI00292F81F7